MKRYSITQETIDKVPQSNWYVYTLECMHRYYSRIRIVVPANYSFQEHMIRCLDKSHDILEWQFIIDMELATDEHVSNVLSGTAFILPNRILRAGNANAFPYAKPERERDY